MSNDGRCGRKSFPQKKHRKTKSSMTRSWYRASDIGQSSRRQRRGGASPSDSFR